MAVATAFPVSQGFTAGLDKMLLAGNKLEARQGAMASGMADCSAPLLLSATFQPDVDAPGGQ